MLVFCGVPINRFYYVWTPVAWLATYAWAVRSQTAAVTGAPCDPQAAF
jgi:hypothetical protein